jgi:hypothetical protein
MAAEIYGKAIRFYGLENIGVLTEANPKKISKLTSLREAQSGSEAVSAY